MPIVVPTTTNVTSAGSKPAVPSAAEIAATGLAGFDGTLATYQRPLASSTATRSVNVPPVSIPTLTPMRRHYRSARSGGGRAVPDLSGEIRTRIDDAEQG